MATSILAVGGGLSNLCLCLCVCVGREGGGERMHSCAGGTGLVERAVINRAPKLASLLTVDLSAFR